MLFRGYKVAELGACIAAPAAASVLARWDAEVIKIATRFPNWAGSQEGGELWSRGRK